MEERNHILELIYKDYYSTIYRTCFVYTGYDYQLIPLIEDCVQDAFVQAIVHYQEFKDYKNPPGWIALVAINRLKNELSKQKRHTRILDSNKPDELITSDHRLAPEDHINDYELKTRIIKFYKSLSDKDKMAFTAYFIDGKRAKEVSVLMNTSVTAVTSRIKRIRKHIKEQIDRSLFMLQLSCILNICMWYREIFNRGYYILG